MKIKGVTEQKQNLRAGEGRNRELLGKNMDKLPPKLKDFINIYTYILPLLFYKSKLS